MRSCTIFDFTLNGPGVSETPVSALCVRVPLGGRLLGMPPVGLPPQPPQALTETFAEAAVGPITKERPIFVPVGQGQGRGMRWPCEPPQTPTT